ncbi:hypothetical protein EUTSA_v10021802mg [Eutrema salsugineum]|uniref:Uncharacterized protein n=2 Tax=Eutrema salsugineum TaxID=72664 RepID=V4MAJ6_EUTSA|nr:hypothetical protein EUTSA_v10021802mg [Eutrema salsugineum]
MNTPKECKVNQACPWPCLWSMDLTRERTAGPKSSRAVILYNLVFKHKIFLQYSSLKMGTATFVEIILAIILPPLGVFLKFGCKIEFWICLILTLLGYLPGIIYALYAITKN